jgi:formylglycine-generating enzyme required for sulfatase activity
MKKTMLIAVVFALMFIACDNGLTGGRDDSTARTNLMVTWPDGLTIGLGKQLKDIDLSAYTNNNTGTFAWASPSQAVSNDVHHVGKHSYTMIFTPSDSERHNTARSSVDVLVSLIDMVRIEPGSFTMGSPIGEPGRQASGDNSEAQWVVALSGFYMGECEVTQKQWEIVTGETFAAFYKRVNSSWASQDYGQGDNFPANYINWYEALVFCNKLSMMEGLTPAYSLNGSTNPADWGAVPTNSNATWNGVTVVADSTGYRLPTEAQWEYACRAGTEDPWYWGETEAGSDEYEWTSKNSNIMSYGYITNGTTVGNKTHEVRKKKSNPWGLYDMLGNASERCWDWLGVYPEEARLNPMGAGSHSNNFRVGRGGSYGTSPAQGRSAARGGSNPYSGRMGLRIVRPEGHTQSPDYNMNLSAIEWNSDASGLSRLLGWYWSAPEFPWNFKNNGNITTTHCCGAEFLEAVYLLCGNVLITYNGIGAKEVTYFTMADDGTFFQRSTGTNFQKHNRRDPYPNNKSDPNAPIVVSNDLLGTWHGTGGTYTFDSDLSLTIGSDEYGYLVYNKNVAILGPLVDGQTTELKEYTFILNGNSLSLLGKGTDTGTVTLTRQF